MKLLVLADIHANWPALSALKESFDACFVVGDIVDYGADPVECIDWVRANATAWVRGNHDHAVAQRVAPLGGSGLRGLAAATRPQHWDVLDAKRLSFLAKMPVQQHIQFDGRTHFLVHATPRDPLDEYLGADERQWRKRLADIEADFVFVGHTHLPFHLDLGDKQLINPGSIGQPRDGDPRASYVVIEDGRVEFKRYEYDIEAAIARLREIGVEGPSFELAEQILRTGGQTPSTPSNEPG